MRKYLLLFISIVTLGLVNANNEFNINSVTSSYYNNKGESFTFVENGITFSVFQNGEFDFYINPRNGLHANVDFGAVSISYNSGYNYDAYVQYDDYGAIIQVESVPIYYDHYGRVVRAGSVRIKYHSNRLVRIGGLRVYYNAYGHYSYYNGFINTYNRHYVYHPYHNYFIRPYYNQCIVSYNPYRLYYKPARYDYHYGRKHYNNHYYKNNKHSKTFRKIDSRVRTADSGRSYQKRSTNNRRIARNNTTIVDQNSRYKLRSQQVNYRTNNNLRSTAFEKNNISNRNKQSQANSTLSTRNRIVKNAGVKRSTVTNRTTVTNKSAKSYNRNKIARSNYNNNNKKQVRKVPTKSVTQSRTIRRNDNNKSLKNGSTVRKKSTKTRTKTSVAQRNGRGKRKNS
jgi:hypothetical protein